MERDKLGLSTEDFQPISTHTLTWSVTSQRKKTVAVMIISTHTLTWSVTAVITRLYPLGAISTHTLTWSVTTKIVPTGAKLIFQLTRSRGA